jgi:hypothetical protein
LLCKPDEEMRPQLIIIPILAALLFGCSSHSEEKHETIRIISWGGIAADKADTLYSLAKECGFDMHLGLYRVKESAVASMDAAARKGIDVIISFPQIKDSTESAVALIKDHPALYAYHIKDEPDTSDFGWLADLSDKIGELDPLHPCYINLLPNWAWGVEEYADKIEMFASEFDMPFYSFDNYPVVEEDGHVQVRPDWYRNLEEMSAMARRQGKPFWGFALAKAHSISDPWPDTVYPEPTLGQLRLQVFSNLLYGAQAIQYFNFTGLVDPVSCEKLPAFELVKQVNSEVRAYSHVFAGCSILGVWHVGDSIPCGTKPLESMPHKKVKSLQISANGGVVALIENGSQTYLAIQNRDCINPAILDISFTGETVRHTLHGELQHDSKPITLSPGNLAIFAL